MEKSCKDCKFYEPYTDLNNKDNFVMVCDIPGVRNVAFCNTRACFTWFEPKNETKAEEKLYTTGQMIDMLLENPKRTAKCKGQAWGACVGNSGNLMLSDYSANLKIHIADNKTKWRIIEPEPQKVSFVEAFKAYCRDKTIESVQTGIKLGTSLKYDGICCATENEIDGEWVILD